MQHGNYAAFTYGGGCAGDVGEGYGGLAAFERVKAV